MVGNAMTVGLQAGAEWLPGGESAKGWGAGQEGAVSQPCCRGNTLLLDISTELKYLTLPLSRSLQIKPRCDLRDQRWWPG